MHNTREILDMFLLKVISMVISSISNFCLDWIAKVSLFSSRLIGLIFLSVLSNLG